MREWINHTKAMAYETGRRFRFPVKITGCSLEGNTLLIDVDSGYFDIIMQKSFGYEFQRFTNAGDAGGMTIKIDAVGGYAFRIRYPGNVVKDETLMAPDVPKGIGARIVETDEDITFILEKASLRIIRHPLRMLLLDESGTMLVEIPGIDACHPNDSGAGGFCSLNDFYPFGTSEGMSTFTTRLSLNERIYGLGEKFLGVDRRGQYIESIHQDCAGNEGARTYKNIPFYMSTAGYGVYVNSAYLMDYDIGSVNFDFANIFLEEDEMDVFLIAGPSLRDILGRYCMITGFAPGLPRWSYGLWMSRNSYENADIVRGIAHRLRAERIPCDVLHLDTYWFEQDWICDLRFSKERFPEPEKLIADLAKQGFSVSIWQMPYVHESQENYREGVEKDYFVKKPNGGIFHFDWFGKQYALMDFSNDDAVKWYVGQIKQVLGMGVKAVKTDIAEGCPAEGVYKTRDGREMHNLFPLIYNKSIFGAVKEVCGKGLVWARSTYAGGQRYPLPWSGDSRSTFENLAGALRSGISIGLSGQPFWSHDIGGFIGKPDPELYVRWAQLGLFSSHARCHGGGNSNPREPWAYGEEALRIFRSFAGLRYRLLPYIFSTEHQSLETGMPFIRHLSLHHQEDRNVHGIYDQYYFGESMMLAPILSRGGKRQVYLPDGTWFDYWTGQKAKKTGWIDAECPLDIMPIFIPAGSVITYGPEQQYVDEKKTAEIEIHVYGGADGAFSYRNDGDTGDFMVKYKDGRTIFDDGGYRGKYKLKVIE